MSDTAADSDSDNAIELGGDSFLGWTNLILGAPGTPLFFWLGWDLVSVAITQDPWAWIMVILSIGGVSGGLLTVVAGRDYLRKTYLSEHGVRQKGWLAPRKPMAWELITECKAHFQRRGRRRPRRVELKVSDGQREIRLFVTTSTDAEACRSALAVWAPRLSDAMRACENFVADEKRDNG